MAGGDLQGAAALFRAILAEQRAAPPGWATAAVGWLLVEAEACDAAAPEALQKAQRVRPTSRLLPPHRNLPLAPLNPCLCRCPVLRRPSPQQPAPTLKQHGSSSDRAQNPNNPSVMAAIRRGIHAIVSGQEFVYYGTIMSFS